MEVKHQPATVWRQEGKTGVRKTVLRLWQYNGSKRKHREMGRGAGGLRDRDG